MYSGIGGIFTPQIHRQPILLESKSIAKATPGASVKSVPKKAKAKPGPKKTSKTGKKTKTTPAKRTKRPKYF
jgi:hypothetical protein